MINMMVQSVYWVDDNKTLHRPNSNMPKNRVVMCQHPINCDMNELRDVIIEFYEKYEIKKY